MPIWRSAADALDEADSLRRLAVGRAQDPVVGKHRLEVGLGDDVGKLEVPVHLRGPTRVEVAEPGGDDDRATLDRLVARARRAAQRDGERPGLTRHADDLSSEPDFGVRAAGDGVDQPLYLGLGQFAVRGQTGVPLRDGGAAKVVELLDQHDVVPDIGDSLRRAQPSRTPADNQHRVRGHRSPQLSCSSPVGDPGGSFLSCTPSASSQSR